MRRKSSILLVISLLVMSLLVTGCVQKSEHEAAVAELNQKVQAALEDAKKAQTELEKVSAELAEAQKEVAELKEIVAKFTTEVTIWQVKDAVLASSKVRVTVEDTVEGLMENAVKELLKTGSLPKDSRLEKLALKADTVVVTFSSGFRTNWPTDVKQQKLAVGAIVQTLTEFKEVNKVVISSTTGAVKIGDSLVTQPLLRSDPLFK